MKNFYVSFGYGHIHKIGDIILDRNCLVLINTNTQREAREAAYKKFGREWSTIYTCPKMQFFPRGVIKMEAL